MRILALLAVCGLTTITPVYATMSQTPVTQPLPTALVEAQQTNWKTSFLFKERTITIKVGDFKIEPTTEYVVYEAARRHTWTNAVDSENDFVTYKYFFDPNDDIVIFDRRANSPVWYFLAVVATAIAMVVFYFIVKKKRTTDVSTQGQYQYPGN